MSTRFIFDSEPSIMFGNGLTLPEDESPSVMTRQNFMSVLMESLFLEVNPAKRHLCNELCYEQIQVVIAKENCYAKEIVPR